MKVLKWAGIVLGGLIVVFVLVAAVLFVAGGSRLSRTHDVQVATINIPADSAAIARGRHLASSVSLCHECHGENLEGKVIFDDPTIASIYASNLTSGRGGVGGNYSDADYARAIRHGVNRDGRGMMIMHSDAYNNFSEEDLTSIIAYMKSMPPVDNEVPGISVAPLGKIFVALGFFDTESMPLIPAEVIDHETPFKQVPLEGANPDYGRYITTIALCPMCHGSDFKGGPPIEEGAPPGPNIAVFAMTGVWSEEQFINTIRTGVTPYGKALNGEIMPWKVYTRMTDVELGAIWRYLSSLEGDENA